MSLDDVARDPEVLVLLTPGDVAGLLIELETVRRRCRAALTKKLAAASSRSAGCGVGGSPPRRRESAISIDVPVTRKKG